jgi:hypothetical protein
MSYEKIKQETISGIHRYVYQHIKPGSFLTAVLSNDLKEAIGQADEDNLCEIANIVGYIYNEIPGICWGSPERVTDWLKGRKVAV